MKLFLPSIWMTFTHYEQIITTCWLFSLFSLIFHDFHDLNPIVSHFHDDVENHNSLQFSFNVHCFQSMLIHINTFNFFCWLFSNSSSQNWRSPEYIFRFITEMKTTSITSWNTWNAWTKCINAIKWLFVFPQIENTKIIRKCYS